jgi:hypothetical protein
MFVVGNNNLATTNNTPRVRFDPSSLRGNSAVGTSRDVAKKKHVSIMKSFSEYENENQTLEDSEDDDKTTLGDQINFFQSQIKKTLVKRAGSHKSSSTEEVVTENVVATAVSENSSKTSNVPAVVEKDEEVTVNSSLELPNSAVEITGDSVVATVLSFGTDGSITL